MNLTITSFTSPISLICAIIGYLIIVTGILFRDEKSNFATWLLWTILDAVVWLSMIQSRSDTTLITCFTVGTGFTTLCLLYKKYISWGEKETYTAMIAFFCALLYTTTPPLLSLIAGSTAIFISGVPFFDDLKKGLYTRSIKYYSLFFLICSASSFIGSLWGNYLGVIFPIVCTLYWSIAYYLVVRNKSLQQKPL